MRGLLLAAGMALVSQPVLADDLKEETFRFIGSVTWDCDDRIAFDGADGGLHDTVSALKIDLDGKGRFTGYVSTSLEYSAGLYNRRYTIAGYEFDEGGEIGVVIDGFIPVTHDELPEGIGWREMDNIIYYIRVAGDAVSLEGVWQDKRGGYGRTVCG